MNSGRTGNASFPTHGEAGAPAMCSMATMCKGVMDKRAFRLLLVIPGIGLIVVGMLIFFEPRVLLWLAGTVSVLLGIGLLVMASFIRTRGVGPNKGEAAPTGAAKPGNGCCG